MSLSTAKKTPVKKETTTGKTPINTSSMCYLSLYVNPACGSGAFLNQAYVYLQKEHQYIADLESKLFDAPITITDVSADILENNLFGVDINEESVEILRLASWLRSAKKGESSINYSLIRVW